MSKHTLGPWQVIEPRTAMLGECYSIRTIAAPADIWNGYVGGVVYSSPNAKANAALIAAAPDLRALQADFTLEGAADRDGLQWVKATPKSRDGQLQSVQIGFQGEALSALEILDSFGQRSVLKFGKVEVNPSLPPSTFQFKVPSGADVIRQ